MSLKDKSSCLSPPPGATRDNGSAKEANLEVSTWICILMKAIYLDLTLVKLKESSDWTQRLTLHHPFRSLKLVSSVFWSHLFCSVYRRRLFLLLCTDMLLYCAVTRRRTYIWAFWFAIASSPWCSAVNSQISPRDVFECLPLNLTILDRQLSPEARRTSSLLALQLCLGEMSYLWLATCPHQNLCKNPFPKSPSLKIRKYLVGMKVE